MRIEDIESVLHEATFRRNRPVSSREAIHILQVLASESGCGMEGCVIHGAKEDPLRLTGDKISDMTSADAWELFLQTLAGAHNALIDNNAAKAKLLQTQALAWESVSKRLEEREAAKQKWEEEWEGVKSAAEEQALNLD